MRLTSDERRHRMDEARRLLQGLEAPYRRLTEWEERFRGDMEELLEDDRCLSDNQMDKLREIHEAKA